VVELFPPPELVLPVLEVAPLLEEALLAFELVLELPLPELLLCVSASPPQAVAASVVPSAKIAARLMRLPMVGRVGAEGRPRTVLQNGQWLSVA
jgi:hypothetical protein